jgi:hypothetical protein
MNDIIAQLEEFYMIRMTELIDQDEFDDAAAVYQEFVIDHQEPEDYLTLTYLRNL